MTLQLPKSQAATVYIVVEAAAGGTIQSNPAIAGADFQRSIDGGAFAQMDSLPTNTRNDNNITIALSAAELAGDGLLIWWADAAGAEWLPGFLSIVTYDPTAGLRSQGL